MSWRRTTCIVDPKSKQYIHEHYHQKGLTLNDIAHKNHVSPNYLSYLFKKYTGYNLWEYVIKLRMEESKRLAPAYRLAPLRNRGANRIRIAGTFQQNFQKIFRQKPFGN